MLKFKDFAKTVIEDLSPEIQSILDSPIQANHKLNKVSDVIRSHLDRGENTGVVDARPNKGSSRTVYAHQTPHRVNLDGRPTNIPAVTKIAYPGHLDKYNDSGKLLGEHQNAIESEPWVNQTFGIIRQKNPLRPHDYETNTHSGILAPHLGSHPENHYLHQGRVTPLADLPDSEFKHLTTHPDFPKGMSFAAMHDGLMEHYDEAHGKPGLPEGPRKAAALRAQNHPLTKKVQSFVALAGSHPIDLSEDNMGVWQHPHTGEEHVVIHDYGFGHEVPKLYEEARQKQNSQIMAFRPGGAWKNG